MINLIQERCDSSSTTGHCTHTTEIWHPPWHRLDTVSLSTRRDRRQQQSSGRQVCWPPGKVVLVFFCIKRSTAVALKERCINLIKRYCVCVRCLPCPSFPCRSNPLTCLTRRISEHGPACHVSPRRILSHLAKREPYALKGLHSDGWTFPPEAFHPTVCNTD